MKHNRRIFPLLFCTILFLFTGCQTAEQPKAKPKPESNPSPTVPISVSLHVNPDAPKPNQPLHFTVQVKQGQSWVKDARVDVELRETTTEKSQMLPAKMTKPGFYETETTPIPGNYLIIAHVTAAGMHQMDYKELSLETEHSHHHGHRHGLIMHIEITKPKNLGEASTLTAHIQYKETPLSGADVRFEVWREGEKMHRYVSAKEQKSGEYTATYTFPKKGTYQVKLHVEKGEIHDHQMQTLILP